MRRWRTCWRRTSRSPSRCSSTAAKHRKCARWSWCRVITGEDRVCWESASGTVNLLWANGIYWESASGTVGPPFGQHDLLGATVECSRKLQLSSQSLLVVSIGTIEPQLGEGVQLGIVCSDSASSMWNFTLVNLVAKATMGISWICFSHVSIINFTIIWPSLILLTYILVTGSARLKARTRTCGMCWTCSRTAQLHSPVSDQTPTTSLGQIPFYTRWV